MKHKIVSTFLAFLSLSAMGYGAPQPQVRVLQTKGTVQVKGKNLAKGDTISPGQDITTSNESAALLGLAPGQYLFVNQDAKLSIKELKQSGSDRSSIVKLDSGAVQSDLHAPKQGTTSQTVSTPCGDLTAGVAAWRTSIGEGPATSNSSPHGLVAVVYAGSVTYKHPKIGEVILTPGQVASMNCDPKNPTLTVVDLTTGRVYVYGPGGLVGDRLATAGELASAAGSFQQGIGAFQATATANAQIALAQVINQINQVLGRNGVPPVGAGNTNLFPTAAVNNQQNNTPVSPAVPAVP